MGIQVTISSPDSGDDDEIFLATSSETTRSTGQYCLDIIVGDPVYAKARYHPFGPDGNAIIRGGSTDGTITVKVRYVDTIVNIKTAANNQKQRWAQYAVNIIDDSGEEFVNLNLVPGGFQQTRKITPMGVDDDGMTDNCFFEASYTFRYD